LRSVDGIDPALFECIYSPAKRRGPVPGKSGTTRKAGDAFPSNGSVGGGGAGGVDWQQQQPAPMVAASAAGMSQQVQQMLAAANNQQQQQQMTLIQKLQQQQVGNAGSGAMQQHQAQQLQQLQQNGGAMETDGDMQQPLARRIRSEPGTADATEPGAIPKTIACHTHLLERGDVEGNRLRAYYRLSIDELYRLPLTPSDEEYCAKWNATHSAAGSATAPTIMTPASIPGAHLAALSASRFAEVALGAVVHQEIPLAMELCNAVVHCLRECVQEQVQDSYLYEVARAYFLLGVFRACRGDMERYFKYRRVALTYTAKLKVRTTLLMYFLYCFHQLIDG